MRRGSRAFRVILTLGLLSSAPGAEAQSLTIWELAGSLSLSETSDETLALDIESPQLDLQGGLDWYPVPRVRVHLHGVVRTDQEDRRRESAGLIEGFLELNHRTAAYRARARLGAFFLPTSREHVDSLWTNPYSIRGSALNGWLGEELRPIGIDLELRRGHLTGGVTIFRGNDAFGSIPAAGWVIRDHPATLDERIDVFPNTITTISAEEDGRLGWAARGRWDNQRTLVQLTFIDNRADGKRYDDILTWRTPFWIASIDHKIDDWTLAGETGWGKTIAFPPGTILDFPLDASYLMASKKFEESRVTLRMETFSIRDDRDYAAALSWLRSFGESWSAAIEATAMESDFRIEFRLRSAWRGEL